MAEMHICTACGETLDAAVRFCPKCGVRVKDRSIVELPDLPPTARVPVAPGPTPPMPKSFPVVESPAALSPVPIVFDPPPPPPPPAPAPAPAAAAPKDVGWPHSPVVATLAAVLPGAGQTYNGQPFKALAFLLFSPLVLPWIWSFFDAHSVAARMKSEGGRFGRGGLVWIGLQIWLLCNLALCVLIALTIAGVLR